MDSESIDNDEINFEDSTNLDDEQKIKLYKDK